MIFKYAITAWLLSVMLKNAKRFILLFALASTFLSNISKNPEKFLGDTEKKVKAFNENIKTKACSFYEKNPSFLNIKIRVPKKLCQKHKRGLK